MKAETAQGVPGSNARGFHRIVLTLRRWFLTVLTFSVGDGSVAMLLLCSLLVVTWSVERAHWVDTPSLALVVTLGVATGVLLSTLRLPALLLHPVGLAYGFVTVVWQMLTLLQAQSEAPRIEELFSRLTLWGKAAAGGGISADELPFAFMLVAFTWLAGYISTWWILRHGNFWGAVLTSGSGILVNMAYLPSPYMTYFFLYVLTVMMMWVRLNFLKNEAEWRQRRVNHPRLLGLLSFKDGFFFALVIIALVYLLPVDRNFTILDKR